jgi:hypothetical protein
MTSSNWKMAGVEVEVEVELELEVEVEVEVEVEAPEAGMLSLLMS